MRGCWHRTVGGRGGWGGGVNGEGGGGGQITCPSQQTCQIWFGSVLVTASYGHYGQVAAWIGPDCIYVGSNFLYPIWFRFSKEGLDHIVRKRPGSDLDGLIRFWPNASGPEASRCARIIGPCVWQNATSLPPGYHFQIRLCSSTDGLNHIVLNQAGFDFGSGWLCQVLAKRIQSGSKPFFWLQESSGPILANASEPIRIGCKSDPACLLGWVSASRRGTVICVVVIFEWSLRCWHHFWSLTSQQTMLWATSASETTTVTVLVPVNFAATSSRKEVQCPLFWADGWQGKKWFRAAGGFSFGSSLVARFGCQGLIVRSVQSQSSFRMKGVFSSGWVLFVA